MSATLDRLVEELAGDVAALCVHAHNDLGDDARVPRVELPPAFVYGTVGDRLALLIWAVRSLRCDACGRFPTHGRLCETCATGIGWTAEVQP